MLVFSRKRDEAIVIGDGIEVRVLRIGREGVRIGIQAPTSVPVHRREIYDLIRAENQTAAQVAVSTPVALIERLRRVTAAPADREATPLAAAAEPMAPEEPVARRKAAGGRKA